MIISGVDVGLPLHVLLFPFPLSGHIIPLLDLASLLLSRSVIITILVTPSNLHLLETLISDHPGNSIRTLVLPLPDTFASRSLPARVRAISQLYSPIVEWFQSHPSPPVAIVSDFFLGWTENLANHLGIPRIVFWSTGALTPLIISQTWQNISDIVDATDENKLISFSNVRNSPSFPIWQAAEIPRGFVKGDPDWEFLREVVFLNSRSWGVIFNSFTELQGVFIEDVKKELGHDRVWAIGPLLPNNERSLGSYDRGGSSVVTRHQVMTWLNDKADDSILYVCFGSRSVLTSEQVGIIAAALEYSGVHFIWRVEGTIPEGFEDRVAERGLIVKGWVPQMEILRHRAVGAFLTHCGWNSLMEGIVSGVLMLTWPLDADQFLNAWLLVDELGVAIRACEGGPKIVPDPENLAQICVQSVSSNQPKSAPVKRLSKAAAEAVQREGSSSKDMDALIKTLRWLPRIPCH